MRRATLAGKGGASIPPNSLIVKVVSGRNLAFAGGAVSPYVVGKLSSKLPTFQTTTKPFSPEAQCDLQPIHKKANPTLVLTVLTDTPGREPFVGEVRIPLLDGPIDFEIPQLISRPLRAKKTKLPTPPAKFDADLTVSLTYSAAVAASHSPLSSSLPLSSSSPLSGTTLRPSILASSLPPMGGGGGAGGGGGGAGGSYFGRDLGETLRGEGNIVPALVVGCVNRLRSKGYDEEGLFRISPATRALLELTAAIDRAVDGQAVVECIARETDTHVVAATLKKYLRELPDPIVPFSCHDRVINAVADEANRVSLLTEVVKDLPLASRQILHYLVDFFVFLVRFEAASRMGSGNIAIVFGPNILRPRNPASDMRHANAAVQAMVDFYPDIFAGWTVPEPKNFGNSQSTPSRDEANEKNAEAMRLLQQQASESAARLRQAEESAAKMEETLLRTREEGEGLLQEARLSSQRQSAEKIEEMRKSLQQQHKKELGAMRQQYEQTIESLTAQLHSAKAALVGVGEGIESVSQHQLEAAVTDAVTRTKRQLLEQQEEIVQQLKDRHVRDMLAWREEQEVELANARAAVRHEAEGEWRREREGLLAKMEQERREAQEDYERRVCRIEEAHSRQMNEVNERSLMVRDEENSLRQQLSDARHELSVLEANQATEIRKLRGDMERDKKMALARARENFEREKQEAVAAAQRAARQSFDGLLIEAEERGRRQGLMDSREAVGKTAQDAADAAVAVSERRLTQVASELQNERLRSAQLEAECAALHRQITALQSKMRTVASASLGGGGGGGSGGQGREGEEMQLMVDEVRQAQELCSHKESVAQEMTSTKRSQTATASPSAASPSGATRSPGVHAARRVVELRSVAALTALTEGLERLKRQQEMQLRTAQMLSRRHASRTPTSTLDSSANNGNNNNNNNNNGSLSMSHSNGFGGDGAASGLYHSLGAASPSSHH